MGLVLYQPKECAYCEIEFTPKTTVQRFCCAACREAYERENRKKKKEDPIAKFKPVMDFIQNHYEETGVLLSYGKAEALIMLKKQKGRKKR